MAGAPNRSRRGMSIDRWVYLAIILLVVAGVGAWAIVAFTGEDSAGPEEDVTIERINEDPRQFLGIDEIQVSGEVAAARQGAIVLGEDGVSPSEQLLVVPAQGATLPAEVQEGQTVQATGELVTFDRLSPDVVAAGLDLDSEFLQRFDGRPVLVAGGLSTDIIRE